MRHFRNCMIFGVAALLSSIPAARAQDSEKSLGDLAREQRDARKLQNPPEKIYTNEDVAPEPDPKEVGESDKLALAAAAQPDSKSQEPPADDKPVAQSGADRDASDAGAAEKPSEPAPEPKPPVKQPSQANHNARPVADRVKEKTPDFLIVPAGTEIKVDISEENPDREPEHVLQGKVVAPVRIGFATAIPALSVATVQLSLRYYDAGYGPGSQPGATNVAQLTAVTVDGNTYEVESNEISVGPTPALTQEVSFTLLRALAIKR